MKSTGRRLGHLLEPRVHKEIRALFDGVDRRVAEVEKIIELSPEQIE